MIMSGSFLRACWLVSAPPTLLGHGSRHCHGINYTNCGTREPSIFRFSTWGRVLLFRNSKKIVSLKITRKKRNCLNFVEKRNLTLSLGFGFSLGGGLVSVNGRGESCPAAHRQLA